MVFDLKTDPSPEQNDGQEYDKVHELYEWAEAVVFSLVLVVLLFTFVFRSAGVDGNSMNNTLQNGDRVILTDFNYKPSDGDIIVLTTKAVEKPIIKRIIAVGGQTVNIDSLSHTVTVDGKAVNESYIRDQTSLPDSSISMTFPLKIPKGYIFVMGDNRSDSYDSRYRAIGLIDERNIVGRAVFRIFPLSGFGLLH